MTQFRPWKILFLEIRRSLQFFFFNDTATTEIYTLSLHDALPIFGLEIEVAHGSERPVDSDGAGLGSGDHPASAGGIKDRKSTRLNSSHVRISYAVFCLKKN